MVQLTGFSDPGLYECIVIYCGLGGPVDSVLEPSVWGGLCECIVIYCGLGGPVDRVLGPGVWGGLCECEPV